MKRSATKDNAGKVKTNRYQGLLRECKDLVLVYLTTQLSEMFEKAEPALLDFADKAETDASQRQFFDALNVIKSRREMVEHRFREEITKGFEEFLQGRSISYPVSLIEAKMGDELEMVDNDDLEEHLAIQTMVAKAHNAYSHELYALGQRLAMARGGQKLQEDDIPASPIHTAAAFQQAAEDFELEKPLILIVYMLFGKFVLEDAGSMYENLNAKLAEAGIFPNLKYSAKKQPKGKERPTTPAQEEAGEEIRSYPGAPAGGQARGGATAGPGGAPTPSGDLQSTGPLSTEETVALGEELFQSIHALLTTRRRMDPRFKDHPEFTPGGDLSKLRDRPTIVSAISEIQPEIDTEILPDPESEAGLPQNVEIDAELIHRVRETLVSEREKLFKDLDRNTIPAADLDTIELVGMLFEEVLNEEELPNIVKALLSHLHTPYLKVAILDHLFLVDTEHVARKLLNLMVGAGRRWVDEEDLRRGIYYPMQECVNRILVEFKEDLSIFSSMFNQLSMQVNELEQRARIVEERNQEAARGRERLESTRMKAQRIISDRMGKSELHPILERFLNHAWLDRMILMMLRDPEIEKSEDWKEVLKVIDTVIRTTDAERDDEVRIWLKKTLPDFKRSVEKGLASLGDYHQPDIHALFKLIASYVKEKPAPKAATPATAHKAAEIKTAVSEAKKEAEPAPRPARKEAAPVVLSEREKAVLEELKKVEFGTWFELLDDQQRRLRLKLSWFSPVTNKYMFVDRFGIQAFITPVDALAKQLASGTAVIIKQPKVPFVDSAMKTIRSLLERTLGMSAAT